MGTRAVKREILDLIGSAETLSAVFARLERYDDKEVVNVLFSAICRDDLHSRWRAITCMGFCVARLAAADMEEARIIMRRLLWSLNDESGGIGWGAPEAMAEIMCCHQGLAEEYSHMLLSYLREDGEELFQDGNFVEHPLLRQGVAWGLARLCQCRPELMRQKGATGDIPPLFTEDDAFLCACAAIAAGSLKMQEARPALCNLLDNKTEITLYQDGDLARVSVASLAQAALEEMKE